jgi:hypothetical protein
MINEFKLERARIKNRKYDRGHTYLFARIPKGLWADFKDMCMRQGVTARSKLLTLMWKEIRKDANAEGKEVRKFSSYFYGTLDP